MKVLLIMNVALNAEAHILLENLQHNKNVNNTASGTQLLGFDPFGEAPVKTVVRNSTFIQTNNGIYDGDDGAQAGDGTPYATLINNVVVP